MNRTIPPLAPGMSIRDKLQRLAWRTVASALGVVAVAMLAFQVWTFTSTMIERLSVIAQVISANVTAALEFEEPRQAAKLLASIQAEKDISSVVVFSRDGKTFAAYGEQTEAGDPALAQEWLKRSMADAAPSYRFRPDNIEYLAPVILHGETIGFVHLHASTEGFYRQLAGSFALILGVTLISGWLAFHWVARLQRRLVDPISRLAESMQQVTEEQNFGIRVPSGEPDEVGQLTTGFNEMLAELEQRDRKLAERSAQLANSNRDLEVAVAEANEAKARAEEATRTKSMFLANMSHEIRTPLNGVLGMTELLLDSALADDQRKLAETALRSGQALMGVINDILDFSKIEAGKLDLDPTDFQLRDLIEDVTGLFAERAQGKGLEIGCRLASDVPLWVRADSGRLRQILSNLLSNAIKFTEHGEISVGARVVERRRDEIVLRVDVTDTGCGIPVEKQGSVFDEFNQGDAGTARRYGGTGLGLSIVRRLTQLMGGSAGLSSRPGSGSSFWFTATLGVPEVQFASEADRDGGGLRGRRVLVVDDNATNREIALAHVLGWGMAADAAAGGSEALHKLGEAARSGLPYDIVLLDLRMPEIDGIAVAQRMRADPQLAGTRIVMLTSMNRVAETQGAREAGVDRYLVKPVRKAQLFSVLRTTLGLAADESETGAESRLRPPPLAGLRVLLVEDNLVNQEVARAILRRFGCEVSIAGGGQEGVSAATSAPFDIVLMDCQMPDLDGYEATARIRAWEAQQAALRKPGGHLPVIALTANAMRGSRETCLAAGMDDFISKPFNRAELQAMLERWCGCGRDLQGRAQAGASPIPGNDDRPKVSIEPAAIDALRAAGGDEFVERLVRLFMDTAPGCLARMREALAAGDGKALAAQAHSLKSASANLGLAACSARARSIEMLGRSCTLAPVAGELDQLASEYGAGIAALQSACGIPA